MNPYKYSLEKSTEKEVNRMLSEGMERLTPEELKDMVGILGFKVSHPYKPNYNNMANEISYKAKMVDFTCEKCTKKHSFAHYECNNLNKPKLQAIRRNSFVFQGGRIWEL